MVVFIVACPCGIGLAVLTAMLMGSGIAARYGILACEGRDALQEMAQMDLVVFDKTGTLTERGELRVSNVILSRDLNLKVEIILGIAAELETGSSHPLAIPIQHYCELHSIVEVGTKIDEMPGRGLEGFFEAVNCMAVIGNEVWMEEHSVFLDGFIAKRLASWKLSGKSVALLAIQDKLTKGGDHVFEFAAMFSVTNELRLEAKEVMSRLQGEGIGTWMVTGDNITTAHAVVRDVGIPTKNVIASIMPHEKVL
jgi:P-type Cu+ transporter